MVELGPFVVMPNHVHGILANVRSGGGGGRGNALESDSQKEGAASSAPTLGTNMRAFKSISAIAINKLRHSPGKTVWQRNYYEHVIRDGREFAIISRYIWENEMGWEFDPDNPSCRASDTAQPWEIRKP
jgi:REP element-mobilizing transposase RayT